MRTITTSKGVAIELDGDIQSVLEALFKTFWDNPDDYSYEHTVREVQHVLGQLTDDESRQYLERGPGAVLHHLRERPPRTGDEEARTPRSRDRRYRCR